jgi:hypothetical protein
MMHGSTNIKFIYKVVQKSFQYSPLLSVSFQHLIYVIFLSILLDYRSSICLVFPAVMFYGAICNAALLIFDVELCSCLL